jgi:prephenate dehydrogenase
MLRDHRGRWRPEAVVTDVASLKLPVMTAAADAGIQNRFVGSHPMAGSEGRGFGAARRGLFRDTRVWLTAEAGAEGAVERVEALWRLAGAEPLMIDPQVHDERMIAASHLPQVLSSLLAVVLESRGTPRSELGPGGRDMTRLAGSAIEMWLPLLRDSASGLEGILREFADRAEEAADALRDGDESFLVELFERAGAWEAKP